MQVGEGCKFARQDSVLACASFAYAVIGTAYGVYDGNAPFAAVALANIPLGFYFRSSRQQRIAAQARISELERLCKNS